MKMRKMAAAALAAVLAVSAPLAGAVSNALSVTASAEGLSENGLSYSVKSDGSLSLQCVVEDMTEINIPSKVQGKSVTEIDRNFFNTLSQQIRYADYHVEVLNIPDSVTAISCGRMTEFDPIPFKEINVSAGNKAYSSEDGVLFTKDKKSIILYPSAKTDTSYTIPNGVEIVFEPSFYGCKNLTSITIPNSVKWLDLNAFIGCEKLTALNIPASVEHINENIYYFYPDGVDNYASYVTMSDGVRVYLMYNDSGNDYTKGLAWCESLTEINVDKNNKFFYSEDGVLFYKDYYCAANNKNDIVNYDDEWSKVLVKYPPAKSGNCYTIPDNVRLAEGSFNFCYDTKVLVVPTGTRSIHYEDWIDIHQTIDYYTITDIYYGDTEEEWKENWIVGGSSYHYAQKLHFNFNPATDTPVQTVTVEKPKPSDPETSDPGTSNPETSKPATNDPTASTGVPGDTDKTSDSENKQETIDATLKNVDSKDGLSGAELEKQIFGDSGWTWEQVEKIEFTSDKLFSVQYTAADGSTKTLGEQTAARAEDEGIWNTEWTLDTSLLSKDKPFVKLIAKDGTADITAKVYVKKDAQKPTNTDQKGTGIALAIAPVVLAAGAVIVISKKRK